MRQFWTIEGVGNTSLATEEEERCEKLYLKNYYRDQNGRYVVRLPFKEQFQQLGNSYQNALNRYCQIEGRLNKNPSIKQQYQDFMREYRDLGHMKLATNRDENTGYYISRIILC